MFKSCLFAKTDILVILLKRSKQIVGTVALSADKAILQSVCLCLPLKEEKKRNHGHIVSVRVAIGCFVPTSTSDWLSATA